MVQRLLEPHGVTLEVHNEQDERYPHCLLRVPEGTRQERAGYLLRNEYNKITLPDGFIFYQTLNRDGWSTIRFLIGEQEREG